ncbi:hypothetical protein JCM24511_08287 [Saitozyma sp. JCM 24511]|nr:hypothetical protein JCM24511_08287 [Saitozyma sp. JCM 24511]
MDLGSSEPAVEMLGNMDVDQVFVGTLVDTPTPGTLRVQRDHLMALNAQGYILHVLPASHPTSAAILSAPRVRTHFLPSHTFLLPTFIDLHIHAPQYLYAGTGLDLPLMQWLDQYAYRAEERVDADPNEEGLAGRVYRRLADRMVRTGTGGAVLFGTIGVEANLVLAKTFLDAGLRGWVGKLSMDQSPRPTYGEPSTPASLSALHTYLDGITRLTSTLPPHRRLVQPIITPRFVPTCSDELLSALATVAGERDLWVQSHMCESADQMEWVESTRGRKDEEVFDQAGLLGPKTVQAHVTSLTPSLIELVKKRGVTLAHCPLSNVYFSDAQFPLREALDAELKVGLGSDIAGGYALSLQTAMRQAVAVSRLREGTRRETQRDMARGLSHAERPEPEIAREEPITSATVPSAGPSSLRVDWMESLYVATRGGKKAMGLGGCFEVGMEFDAQKIELASATHPSGTGPLDFFDFDLDPASVSGTGANAPTPTPSPDEAWWTEAIERWWCNGDERNRVGIWVQGKELDMGLGWDRT